MERMTKQQEAALMSHVKDVISGVSGGDTPSDALYKVASENELTPQLIRRVSEAYNQSRTLFELGEKQGNDRLNTFALANPDTAIGKLYPEQYQTKKAEQLVKKAVASYKVQDTTNYFDLVKSASVKTEFYKEAAESKVIGKPHYATDDFLKRIGKSHHEKKKVKDDAVDAQVKLSTVIRNFQEDFRQNIKQTPFHVIEIGMHQKYGSAVTPLVKLAFELSGVGKFGHRRASPAELDATRETMIDFRGPGFASMESLVGAAMDMHKKASELKKIEIECGDACSEDQNKLKKAKSGKAQNNMVTPEDQSETGAQAREACGTTEKKALFEPITNLVGWGFGQSKGVKNQAQADYKNELDKNIASLEDPKFRNGMNQIKVQTNLHDLMSNDEVISSYEPEEVTEAFNHIYEIAPDAAKSHAVMRDMLRRYLVQGGIESLEAGQAAQLNKNMRETHNINDRSDRIESMQADPRLREAKPAGKSMGGDDKAGGKPKPTTPDARINF